MLLSKELGKSVGCVNSFINDVLAVAEETSILSKLVQL